MAERKKVDRKRRELEKKIEIYKKNNKALCDMLALYGYFVDKEKSLDITAYIVLDEVIEDLEDKDVNVPFKSESIAKLFDQDSDYESNILRELRETEYYQELREFAYESYLTMQNRQYYRNKFNKNNEPLSNEPYDFLGKMCNYSCDFVSEILCSNIEISKKINILYDVIRHYIGIGYLSYLEYTLNSKGSGYELSRTNYEVKEQKIAELSKAFKIEMDKDIKRKRTLLNVALGVGANPNYVTNCLCFLQEQKLVDFMDLRMPRCVGKNAVNSSILFCFNVNNLDNFKNFYQLEDYLTIPKEVRKSDDAYILDNIQLNDIASFISLSNYEITTDDIETIGERVRSHQIAVEGELPNLKEGIKKALIKKAKTTKEYRTMSILVQYFEKLTDYKAYRKQIEAERNEQEQKERELFNARHQLVLRLSNIRNSLNGMSQAKDLPKEN